MFRVLAVDDHAVVRAGLRKILEEYPGGVILGEAASGAEALQSVRDVDWDVVIMDVTIGGRSGLQLLKQMQQLRPGLAVLVFSKYGAEQYEHRALAAGATGFVTKETAPDKLIEAVAAVARGERPRLGEPRDKPPHEQLSDREYEVMCLIASGKTIGEIAGLLSLSQKTVSTYRTRVLEKMGFKTNAALMHYAIQSGLVTE